MLVFTSCTANYLPKAAVLAESLKKFHPNWQFCLVLADKIPANLPGKYFDRILTIEDFEIAQRKAWIFGHSLIELCTAVKGIALYHFLQNEHYQKIIYFDPDIMVFASLDPLIDRLDNHDILLTPHQLQPESCRQAIIDNEICSLQHGVFNLGFLGCAATKDGLRFASFWRDRLLGWCHDNKSQGLFTDQKWCDLAPAFFPGLGIVRDPGCNTASWNLTNRYVAKNDAGQFTVNGEPLRFYHFSGYDSGAGRKMTGVYGSQMPAVGEIWNIYDKKLREKAICPTQAWHWGFYSNGRKITPAERRFYRDAPQMRSYFPDPYLTDATGKEGFAGYCQQQRGEPKNFCLNQLAKPWRLGRLAYIYLAKNGGSRALPKMIAHACSALGSGGPKKLLQRIRNFKNNLQQEEARLTWAQLFDPANRLTRPLAKTIICAFEHKPGLLIIDHDYGGGANKYREQRIRQYLKSGRNCLLLAWDFFANCLKCRFLLAASQIIEANARDLQEITAIERLRFERMLVNELVLWSNAEYGGKDHYKALPALLAQIRTMADHYRARLEIAVHDFYSICPSYNLLEKGVSFCNIPQNAQRCAACLAASPFGAPPDFNLDEWRRAWQRLYDRADEISIFSRTSGQILQKIFSIPGQKLNFHPHEPLTPLQPLPPPKADWPLRIGVPGNIMHHKGSDILRQLADLLQNDESIVVIGQWHGNPHERLLATGAYEQADLADLVRQHKITCVFIPSIWPETFCYVVQEVMQLQLPLVVFPLGAQAERTAAYKFGKIAAQITPEAALAAIYELDRKRKAALIQ